MKDCCVSKMKRQVIRVVSVCTIFTLLGRVDANGDKICNIPVSGTLQAGNSVSPNNQIRLGINANTQDDYYVGSKITMTSGLAAGYSSVITAYCGQAHDSCPGIGGSGLIQAVSMPPQVSSNNQLIISQQLQLQLPSVDSNNFVTPSTGTISGCFDSTTKLQTFFSPSCAGPYKGLKIQIIEGTGSGQTGVIQGGPDSGLNIIVSGLYGTCYGGCSSRGRTVSNYELSDQWVNPSTTIQYCDNLQPSQANNGASCTTNADCTFGGVCQPPVTALNSRYIITGLVGGQTCNPVCNRMPSFLATVDFPVTVSVGDQYTVLKGCYDEQYGNGMRRLGGAGTGAGQQSVKLSWKTLLQDGDIVGRPALTADGSVIVASARGTLTKVSQGGLVLWTIYVGAVVSSPAVGPDGTIYFGSSDRNIWAVTDGGMTKWRFTTPLPVISSPLATEDAVYIGDRNGTFYRFNVDGSVAWKIATDGEIWGGSSITRDGRVIFGSMDKYLYCLNASSGERLWRYFAEQEIAGTPLIQDVSIVFGTREDQDSYGRIINLKMDGTLRWQYPVTSSIDSQPAEGSNGEVYVATVDGRIFAVQADGQLLWKYITGGTGGVCPLQGSGSGYATDFKTVASVASNAVTLAGSSNLPSGYYAGYRATFTIGMGTLVQGQFIAVQQASVQYVPAVNIHDTVFLDTSSQPMALVVSFTVKDTMIAGESLSLILPGLTAPNLASVLVYPQDLINTCSLGSGSVCVAAGKSSFNGAQGTASSGTSTTIVLSPAASCSSDNGCVGSSIQFVSGTGAGQAATIVKYVHFTLTATISFVATPADSTTIYAISPAPVSKYSASWTTGTPGSMKFSVLSSTGTSTACTPTLCTSTQMLLDPADKAAAGYYNGHTIEFVSGMGKGQTATCLLYYGSSDNRKCQTSPVAIPPDSTTTYRIGPLVAAGEVVTLVIAASNGFTYPHYSGTVAAGSASSATLSSQASSIPNFYVGMNIEVQFIPGAVTLASAITNLDSTVISLTGTVATSGIEVGNYMKIDGEVMLIEQIAGNTITVYRAAFGTAAATHAAGATPTAYAYRTITAYTANTMSISFSPDLIVAVAQYGNYRIAGANSFFSFTGVSNTNFQSLHIPFVTSIQPTEYGTTSVTLMLEATLPTTYYVGASLYITNGPGTGLQAMITGYSSGTGIASVSFNLGSCGGPSPCGPKGTTDPGYLASPSPTSAYVLSQYEIRVVYNVVSFSAQTLTLAQSPTFVLRPTYGACITYDDATTKRVCTTLNPNAATPVRLEWASGSWCQEAGGTGWGATSPCVANGLIVTTSSNRYVYGLGTDGSVKFKFMTGKRIKAPPRCIANRDQTITVFVGSNDHHIYRLDAPSPKILRGTSWV